MKVTDPVCKMTIADKDAAATSKYKGTTYYFCSKACKEDFDNNPEDFLGKISPSPEPQAIAEGRWSLAIEGMNCVTCSQAIEKSLAAVPGVKSANVNFAAETAYVEGDVAQVTMEKLAKAVAAAGYRVRKPRTAIAKAELLVPGMSSDHCVGIVTTSIRRLDGIVEVHANLAAHRVSVRYNSEQINASQIKTAVEQAGYEVAAIETAEAVSERHEEAMEVEMQYLQRAWNHFWFAAVPTSVIMAIMMIHMFWEPVPAYLALISLLAFPVVFLKGGFATHRSAWRSLSNRTPNMDVLISMGSLPPYIIGLVGFIYPMTSFIEMASTIMTFHLLGRYLETRAKGRASQAIKKLLKLGAKTATVLRDGSEIEVPIVELRPGDIMLVRPGAKIPTDGEIIEGVSHIDESIATGESVPIERVAGDRVIGATINKEGFLKVRATRVGKDTFLAQVIRLVEEAQGSKVPIQEFADRVTGKFVPAVIALALASLAMWLLFEESMRPILYWGARFLPWVNPEIAPLMAAILPAVAVLVIACPCALGLATPTALMVGSGLGAERGILIRSGEAIQTLKDINVIVLDKTGTITKGEPSLTDVIPAGGFDEQSVLSAAASVEAGSEHPLGQAVVAAVRNRGIETSPVKEFRAITARGVEGRVNGRFVRVGSRLLLSEAGIDPSAMEEWLVNLENQGKTAMLVAIDDRTAGVIAVADTIKPDSKSAIAALKAMGIRPVMITGDNERTARHIASEVGIEEVLAGVLPEGKVDAVRNLQEKYDQRVAMVGDGINDAPALKQANVGIAIGAGADIAIEAADVTLVSGELTKVVEAVRLSRATFRKILQNLFWAWFYNTAAIPIAAAGLLHPMIGVIAMTSSSLSVIGNSLLLKRARLSD